MEEQVPAGWRRHVRTGDTVHTVRVQGTAGRAVRVLVDDRRVELDVVHGHVLLEGASHTTDVEVDEQGTLVAVWIDGRRVDVELLRGPARMGTGRQAVEGGLVRSPMNGQVIKILAAPGQTVAAGDCIVVLEAMKMENEVRTAVPGRLVRLEPGVGQTVARGDILFEVVE